MEGAAQEGGVADLAEAPQLARFGMEPLQRHTAGAPLGVTGAGAAAETAVGQSPTAPSSSTSPFVHCGGGRTFFGFTLRRAEGIGFGLDVVSSDGDRALLVRGILTGCAVEAWNRQVVGSPNAAKAVVPGDKIVRVNERARSAAGMLDECERSRLLTVYLVRGGLDPEAPLAWLEVALARHRAGSGMPAADAAEPGGTAKPGLAAGGGGDEPVERPGIAKLERSVRWNRTGACKRREQTTPGPDAAEAEGGDGARPRRLSAEGTCSAGAEAPKTGACSRRTAAPGPDAAEAEGWDGARPRRLSAEGTCSEGAEAPKTGACSHRTDQETSERRYRRPRS